MMLLENINFSIPLGFDDEEEKLDHESKN